MSEDDDNLAQAMRVVNEPGSEPYTLTEDDIGACRSILAQLIADDQVTGGYAIGNVQAYPGKAQVMVEFAKRCDAMSAGEIAARAADSVARLGHVCRKVIAHYDTNHERMKKLEEYYAAAEAWFGTSMSTPGGDAVVERVRLAREALG